MIDLHPKSSYQYIISKENKSNDLIQFDFLLFNYPKNFKKKPKDQKSFIKGYLQKLNIIFLYKHIDLILSIINSFKIKQQQQQQEIQSSNEENFLSSIFQKYEEQSLEFHMDFLLDAPTILIPFNSYSNQAIFIDLGKLTFHTDLDKSSSNEKHTIKLENLSANRIRLNETNQINLFESSTFTILVNRYLNHNDELSIDIQWDNIDLKLSKCDYASINQIFKQNFKEKIFYKIPQIQNQDEQEQDYPTVNIPKKQSSTKKISPKIRFNFQIKQISLTLYLEKTNDQLTRDENSKFFYLTIQFIQAVFQQSSNSTYKAKLQIQHLYGDDPRQDNQYSRFINKGFKVNQNTPLLIGNLKNETSTRTGKSP
jgi:hypothetical protein